MKKLFIAYSHSKGYSNYIKNVPDDYEITSREDIQELEREIFMSSNVYNIVITNMIMLPIK